MNEPEREIKDPSSRAIKKHHPAIIWVLSLLPIILASISTLDLLYGAGHTYSLGPHIGLVLGVVALVLAFRMIGSVRAIIVLVLMIFCWYPGSTYYDVERSNEAQIKSNLHAIHIALERYAVDTGGRYPEDINSLIDERYLSQFPANRYVTGDFIQMVPIEFGEEPFEGNFRYVPLFDGDDVIGFYLFNYGLEDEPGRDVNGDGVDDHVLLVITNGIIGDEAWPPLVELLE